MASHIKILEMENVKLKEDKKKVTKHFGQKKTDDDTVSQPHYIAMYVC